MVANKRNLSICTPLYLPPTALALLDFIWKMINQHFQVYITQWIWGKKNQNKPSVHLWLWKFLSGGHWMCSSSQMWLSFVPGTPAGSLSHQTSSAPWKIPVLSSVPHLCKHRASPQLLWHPGDKFILFIFITVNEFIFNWFIFTNSLTQHPGQKSLC